MILQFDKTQSPSFSSKQILLLHVTRFDVQMIMSNETYDVI